LARYNPVSLHDALPIYLRRTLAEKDVVASDRRWRHSLDLLRARAAIHGRPRVSSDDMKLLAHVLWTEPSERATVEEALRQVSHRSEEHTSALQSRENLV